MKEAICRAFCDNIGWRSVPSGYAVTTPFMLSDGDPVLIYIVREEGKFRIEDDGRQVPMLEASGVDIGSGHRKEAFEILLAEYSLDYARTQGVIRTGLLTESDVPAAVLMFVAVLLRLQDFDLLTPRSVRNTFRDDAIAAIQVRFEGRAEVSLSAAVSGQLQNYPADVVVSASGASPFAVYFGTSDEKALQALVLKMETEKYREIPCRVVLLLERAKDNPLREVTYSLAQARLDEVLSFRGVEIDSMAKLDRLFFASPLVH